MSRRAIFHSKKTEHKQAVFRDEFRNQFDELLKNIHDIATMKELPKIENSFIESIWRYVTTRGSQAVPFIGIIASDFLNVGFDVKKQILIDAIIKKSQTHNNYLSSLDPIELTRIGLLIEETSYDISRIYEHQISMLNDTNVEILAKYAVAKIFGTDTDTLSNLSSLNYHDLLKIILQDSDDKLNFMFVDLMRKTSHSIYKKFLKTSKKEDYAYLDTLSKQKWTIDNIFTKPGIREESGGTTKFKIKIASDTEHDKKYGFRAEIFGWDVASNQYISSVLDQIHEYKDIDPIDPNLHIDTKESLQYEPSMRIVSQNDVDSFINLYNKSKESSHPSFIEHFKNNHHITQADVIAVFRGAKFYDNTDISGSDLSNLDMSRMEVQNNNWTNCNLTNTRMVAAYLTNTNLDGSDIKDLNLCWSHIHNVNMQIVANFHQQNFKFATIKKLIDDLHKIIPYSSLGLNGGYEMDTRKEIIDTRKEIIDTRKEIIDIHKEVTELKRNHEQIISTQVTTHGQILSTLVKVVARQDQLDSGSEKSVILASNIPDEPDEKFIVTSEYLKAQLEEFSNIKRVIIVGESGSGKTTFAHEYAKKKMKSGAIVHEIDAGDFTKFSDAYANFAFRLGVNKSDTNKFWIESINDKIKSLEQEIILILDGLNNVDDYEKIKEYICTQPSNVKVIITSTNLNLIRPTIHLKPFEESAAIEYLDKNLAKNALLTGEELTQDNITKIYKKISSMGQTFAFEVSAAVDSFNNAINEGLAIVESIDAITLDSSRLFNSLISKKGLEWMLIQYFSYLDQKHISFKLMHDLVGKEKNFSEIRYGINNLKKLSLVKDSVINDKLPGISLHSRVQENYIKYCQSHPNPGVTMTEEEIFHQLLEFFDNQFSWVEESKDEKWEQVQEYLSHTIRLTENKYNNPEFNLHKAHLLSKLGEYNRFVLFQYDEAISYHQEALRILELMNQNPKIDNEIANEMHFIGESYKKLSKFDEAVDWHTKGLNSRLKIQLGQDSDDLAKSYTNLADALCDKGDNVSALSYANSGLEMSKRLYINKDHKSLSEAWSTLGKIYSAEGDYKKSLKCREESLEVIQNTHKGKANLDQAKIYNDISDSLIDIGIYDLNSAGQDTDLIHQVIELFKKAEINLKQAIEIKISIYSNEDHITISTSYNNLADLYLRTGMAMRKIGNEDSASDYFNKSAEFNNKSLNIKQKIAPNQYLDLARSYNNLGTLHLKGLHESHKAAKYQTLALENYKKAFQGPHEHIARTLKQLGDCWINSGEELTALNYYKSAFEMYQKTPPSNAFKIVYSDIYAILQEKDPEFLSDFEASKTHCTISANKEPDSETPQVVKQNDPAFLDYFDSTESDAKLSANLDILQEDPTANDNNMKQDQIYVFHGEESPLDQISQVAQTQKFENLEAIETDVIGKMPNEV